ncbi:hypothetical protein FEM48_Zijuj06G0066000 [Ziziphus jujuba var. spinosa]|uniref:Legume lectin domain-containing protein n=1 Tax=Ziziphus jujuba var. spinosa TaxID=714518 RepID=A0A978V7R1_ZIZJJ|nr:hypothetical protein FEM48_Zijuj06G0066000 [Ziziphus jujuba var. spinosa]
MLGSVLSYGSTMKNLTVSWTYKKQPVSMGTSSLSHILDLKEVLPKWVTIGFSTTTGLYVEGHTINSWEFSSSLDADKVVSKKGLSKHFIALISSGVFFFILLLGICIWIWKMKCKRTKGRSTDNECISVDTDLEKELLPKDFPTKKGLQPQMAL